jgi:hypothetical protein
MARFARAPQLTFDPETVFCGTYVPFLAYRLFSQFRGSKVTISESDYHRAAFPSSNPSASASQSRLRGTLADFSAKCAKGPPNGGLFV